MDSDLRRSKAYSEGLTRTPMVVVRTASEGPRGRPPRRLGGGVKGTLAVSSGVLQEPPGSECGRRGDYQRASPFGRDWRRHDLEAKRRGARFARAEQGERCVSSFPAKRGKASRERSEQPFERSEMALPYKRSAGKASSLSKAKTWLATNLRRSACLLHHTALSGCRTGSSRRADPRQGGTPVQGCHCRALRDRCGSWPGPFRAACCSMSIRRQRSAATTRHHRSCSSAEALRVADRFTFPLLLSTAGSCSAHG